MNSLRGCFWQRSDLKLPSLRRASPAYFALAFFPYSAILLL